MEAQVIQEIRDLVLESQIIDHDGKKYVPRSYKILRQIEKTPGFEVSTLESLVAFIMNNPQGLDLGGAIAIITDDMEVKVLSAPHIEDKQRNLVIGAKSDFDKFRFDTFQSSETFNIHLQTRFVYNDQAKELFTVASKLVIDEGVTLSDDGMSQKLTVKRGMSSASAQNMVIPSRMALRPYRIFPECEQPESLFLVRLKGDQESGAYVGLWETDGGAWKSEAKKNIRAKLEELNFTLPIYA